VRGALASPLLYLGPGEPQEDIMMSWVVTLFVIALVAAIFGFGGIAASAAGAAKIVFVVALALAVIGFIADRAKAT
jgi:uncharacterized membrane protein YtjA (UPF0391 family)